MLGKTGLAVVLAASFLLIGCASKPTATQTATPSTGPAPKIVKSKNGQFEGEIIGTPAPRSQFAKLQIGMTMREVSDLIGAPHDMVRHETGKRWIPFYFGNDAQRLQTLHKGEGCLTYTGGNVFGGGGNELIRITVDPKGACLDS